MNYLNDKTFLKQLDEIKNKKIYTKLLLLDKYSRVEEELMGYAKEGSSLAIDASSVVRRTCSLTLVMDGSTEEKNAEIQNLLSLNRKLKLQIGIKNNYASVFPEYEQEEYFWFPLGTFFITTISYSNSLDDGLTISLSLSDKMCLLNGESGGVIPADTVLNTVETYVPEIAEDIVATSDEKEENVMVATGRMIASTGEQVPLEQIIIELVNHFGGEELNNILLNLPENVRLCQTWGGNSYKLFCDYEEQSGTDEYNKNVKIKDYFVPKKYYLNDSIKNQDKTADQFRTTDNISNSINEKDRQYLILRKKQIKIDNEWYDYYIMKDGPIADPDTSVYGDAEVAEENKESTEENKEAATSDTTQTTSIFKYSDGVDAKDLVILNAAGDIGFTFSELVYPNTSNDFIASKGTSITDTLDNIKEVLENYEYFYDVNGVFKFQEIKNYLNTSQSTGLLESLKAQKKEDSTYENTLYSFDKYRDKYVYDFTNSPLIIDISNDPQYSLVKNDFIIWGESGAGLPIRYHIAIDDIPDATWCYTGYWMYSKMVCLDTSTDSIDTKEGSYTTTLTYLWEAPATATSKADLPVRGQLDTYYYLPGQDYNDNTEDCDKVYYWNGVDYYILYLNGSGRYSFVLEKEEEEELWEKYGDNGTKEWGRQELTDQSETPSYYYTMQINEKNKEDEAAQTALDHPPYTRVVTIQEKNEKDEVVKEKLKPEIVDGRGYQVRYVKYNTTNDWRTSIFLEGKQNEVNGTADNNYYYAELKAEWPKIIDIKPPEREGSSLIGDTDSYTDNDEVADGVTLELKDSLDLTQATYYLDILSPSDKIKKFSVSAIGRRSDVYPADTGVNCIFEKDLPPYVYIDNGMANKYKEVEYTYKNPEEEQEQTENSNNEVEPTKEKVLTDFSLEMMQQEIIQHSGELNGDDKNQDTKYTSNQIARLQDTYNKICAEIKAATELGYNPVVLYHSQYKQLQGGGAACSAYEQAKNIIYSGTGYNEKVTVTMMPVYYLEPNTRIRLQDTASGVNGDYIIDSIDLPLDGTGTMSLVCSRALDKM